MILTVVPSTVRPQWGDREWTIRKLWSGQGAGPSGLGGGWTWGEEPRWTWMNAVITAPGIWDRHRFCTERGAGEPRYERRGLGHGHCDKVTRVVCVLLTWDFDVFVPVSEEWCGDLLFSGGKESEMMTSTLTINQGSSTSIKMNHIFYKKTSALWMNFRV